MTSIEMAQQLIESKVKKTNPITVPILECQGYTLAEDIYSDRDYPPFNRAAMDGFAIRSDEYNTNNIKKFKILDTLLAGNQYDKEIPKGYCIKIMTGAPVPHSLDCIVKIEECVVEDNQVQFSTDSIKPFKNIARKGEDIKNKELLLEKGKYCNPSVISVLATIGYYEVKVYPKPTIAIISTGDEIVSINDKPKDYQIRDSNSYVIQALFQNYHIKCDYVANVNDNKNELQTAIKKGLTYDILIISGGVSMGDADFVPEVLTELGVEKILHNVNIKPGKPLWFGTNQENVVFGLPGNPMSCQVSFKVFIEHYLRKFMNLPNQRPLYLPLAKEYKKKGNRVEFFSCQWLNETGELLPLHFMGSGDITSTLDSDGLAVRSADIPKLEKGDVVQFYPWKAI